MTVVNFSVIRTPSIIMAGIVAAIFIRLVGFPEVALVLLCNIVILSCYYSAVYLFRRNDSMMGGLPQAGYGYSTGMAIMLSGNVILCAAFILALEWMAYVGVVLIVMSTGLIVGSCSLLFRHIVRRGLKSNN
jgi:hypothetical protein